MKIFPIAITTVDWVTLNKMTREFLGSPISAGLDKRGIDTKEPDALSRIATNNQQAHELTHMAVLVKGYIEIERIRDCANLHFVELGTSRKEWIGIITGTLKQWDEFCFTAPQSGLDGLQDLATNISRLLSCHNQSPSDRT